MAKSSSISSKTVIRGRIVAEGPLEIHGHVEGHIEAQSDVTIGDGALIKSDVQGQRVVVSGAVAGNVRGAELVVLESGARVVGDLSAPSVGIRPGALVRGHVEAGEQSASGLAGARPSRARTETRKPEIRKPVPPAAKSSRGKKAPPAPVIPRASGQAKKTTAKKRSEAPAPVVPRGAAKRRTTAKRRSR